MTTPTAQVKKFEDLHSQTKVGFFTFLDREDKQFKISLAPNEQIDQEAIKNLIKGRGHEPGDFAIKSRPGELVVERKVFFIKGLDEKLAKCSTLEDVYKLCEEFLDKNEELKKAFESTPAYKDAKTPPLLQAAVVSYVTNYLQSRKIISPESAYTIATEDARGLSLVPVKLETVKIEPTPEELAVLNATSWYAQLVKDIYDCQNDIKKKTSEIEQKEKELGAKREKHEKEVEDGKKERKEKGVSDENIQFWEKGERAKFREEVEVPYATEISKLKTEKERLERNLETYCYQIETAYKLARAAKTSKDIEWLKTQSKRPEIPPKPVPERGMHFVVGTDSITTATPTGPVTTAYYRGDLASTYSLFDCCITAKFSAWKRAVEFRGVEETAAWITDADRYSASIDIQSPRKLKLVKPDLKTGKVDLEWSEPIVFSFSYELLPKRYGEIRGKIKARPHPDVDTYADAGYVSREYYIHAAKYFSYVRAGAKWRLLDLIKKDITAGGMLGYAMYGKKGELLWDAYLKTRLRFPTKETYVEGGYKQDIFPWTGDIERVGYGEITIYDIFEPKLSLPVVGPFSAKLNLRIRYEKGTIVEGPRKGQEVSRWALTVDLPFGKPKVKPVEEEKK